MVQIPVDSQARSAVQYQARADNARQVLPNQAPFLRELSEPPDAVKSREQGFGVVDRADGVVLAPRR
ncbi:hypothetical protein [Streptomyces sp. NPDC018352]|uniref:hypothetical protein n=1 Tax=Streptomyces sp. NPDC018352 TaxID=3157194 RepID=UPI0034049E55